MLGVDSDGKQPDGATSWEWRPPQRRMDDTHTDPLLDGYGRIMGFQQSPPIHVTGSPAKPGKAQKTVARGIGEDRAQEQYLLRVGERTPRAVLAAAKGMTPSQLRRAITERNKRRAR